MAEPTPSQIKDRIVTLCGTIATINTAVDTWPDDQNPFTAAELPAIVVEMTNPAASNIISADRFSIDREFLLTVLAARFPVDYKLRSNTSWEKVEPYLVSVPSFFNKKRRLEHNDSGLAVAITLPSLRAVTALAFDRALYVTAEFRMTVRTYHS